MCQSYIRVISAVKNQFNFINRINFIINSTQSLTRSIQRLAIGIKGQAPILAGELDNPIHADESMWLLEEGKRIVVTLDKVV